LAKRGEITDWLIRLDLHLASSEPRLTWFSTRRPPRERTIAW
jgi:hypothetical protein